MKNKYFYTLLTVCVIFIFIFSLFTTTNVLADDSTPPAPTEEPVDVPVATEIPTENLSVPEALAQLPDGTEVVVLDQNGDALPLASTDAAEVLAAADPYFWDGTQYVGYSSSGLCPAIVVVCNTNPNPIQAAVDAFAASGTASGNIYVEAGTYTENVVVDGTAGGGYLANLAGIIGDGSYMSTFIPSILQGYFEITNMNAFTLSGFNLEDNGIDGGYVYAHDNNGTLTLNDLVVSNPNGNGIEVGNHTGDVELNEIGSFVNDGDGINIDTDGSVTLTDAFLLFSSGDGIDISATQDVTLTNVTVICNGNDLIASDCLTPSGTGGDGIIIDTDGNVTLDAVGSSTNIGDGISIIARGNISLNDVSAEENQENGAYLDNCVEDGGCNGTGDVSVTNSDFDGNTSNGDDMGLEVNSTGSVILNNVSASDNWAGDGSDIYGFSSLLVQDSVFNDNYSDEEDWGYGLYIYTDTGDVTLVNVEASGNDSLFGYTAGTYIETDGDVNVTGGNFSDNGCGCIPVDGLEIYDAGSVTLTNVVASGNSGDGVYTEDVETVSVFGGSFNDNDGYGLDLWATTNVTLENMQANDNGASGAYIGSADPMDVNIMCSEFSDNEEYGLEVDGAGNVVLDRDTFSNNVLGDYFMNIATVSVFSNGNCSPGLPKKLPGRPLNIINIENGTTAGLDCISFSGTELILPNGDKALFSCPLQDNGKLDIQTNDTLPGKLPGGNTFGSAFTVHLITDGKEQITSDPAVRISFVIPEDLKDANLDILFWDGSKWIEVNGANSGNGYFEAYVNFMGTFVLVSK